MSDTCKCGSAAHYDCGRSDIEHDFDVMKTKAAIAFKLLNRNTQPGYPMEADTGECYYCGQGLCEDEDGYQDDELMTPQHHKPDCAWRQAREFIEQEMKP